MYICTYCFTKFSNFYCRYFSLVKSPEVTSNILFPNKLSMFPTFETILKNWLCIRLNQLQTFSDTQTSVKSIGKCKKKKSLYNQPKTIFFFKKLLWSHFWIDFNIFYTKTFGIVYSLFVYFYEWFLFVHHLNTTNKNWFWFSYCISTKHKLI